ncbi:hypothetical protein N7449_002618 [Penicillium cf. viridicatum]|uniref:Uncharacterized protein n=1 Tax=Penicillium cf. viridicatum TaxID=2972119 RepID=A0A9W9MVR0_9EURO|nr:hypothetical protein N7449_002618 [Penicillium cf. viridicatum]
MYVQAELQVKQAFKLSELFPRGVPYAGLSDIQFSVPHFGFSRAPRYLLIDGDVLQLTVTTLYSCREANLLLV